MKKKFNHIRFISAILILTCSMLFNERTFGQSQDSWDEDGKIESASNTAAILGAIAGVAMATTLVFLIIGWTSGDDKKPKQVKKTKKAGNEKDSTSTIKSDTTSIKSDTTSIKKREEGK